jgi:hypothetical protein
VHSWAMEQLKSWLNGIWLSWLAWRRFGVRRRAPTMPTFAPGSLVAYVGDGTVRPAVQSDAIAGVYMGMGEDGSAIVRIGDEP